MASEGSSTEPYFIAYIDEAGDPGIGKVYPIDPNGASEWFTVGCTVIRASYEPQLVPLVRSIKTAVYSLQSPDLHFRNLSEHKKKPVCDALAAADVRMFVVASHKPNMRGYRNPQAEAVSLHKHQYFYNYCIRILLERVTEWCVRWSERETGAPRPLKLVFSQRGGHSYRHVRTYLELLSIQALRGNVYQDAKVPDFRVLNPLNMEVIGHNKNAGCQIADVVASSFYQAVNAGAPKWNTSYAEALKPRIASRGQWEYRNVGVTLLPWRNWTLRLTEAQKSVFRFYGHQI